MRFFKYLFFLNILLFSTYSFSAEYSVQYFNLWRDTPQLACNDDNGGQFMPQTLENWPERVGYCANNGRNVVRKAACSSFVSTKPISVPGWADWGIDETDAYHSKIANTTVCHDGCRYKNPTMSGSEGSDLMSLDYKNPVQDSSCPNTTEQPDTPPPNTPTKPPVQCSGDYCAQPQGNSCPSGYATQSFNNQNYCVKNGTPPLSPSNPPTSSGNGFDAQGIINAINNAATSIQNALSTGFTSVTNALGITNQKLDAANAKLDTGNGHLNDIKNNTNAINGKLDATNQKLDESNQKHDATNAKLDTGNGHLNDIKNNTNATNGKLDATNQKLDALNNAATSIQNALSTGFTSVTNALSTGFTSVTNALGITNQKLDAANAKSDTGNGHLNEIKNNTNATNGKLDATNQKLDAANQKHDATNAKLDTGNGHLNDIKNNTNATNQKLDAANAKLDEINQNGKDGNGLLQQIKDFFTEEHSLPTDSTTVPHSDIDLPDYEKDYVSWSPTCPPDVHVPISLMGQSSTLNLSWSPICELLSKLRWAIIACAYFAAAYIILGMR